MKKKKIHEVLSEELSLADRFLGSSLYLWLSHHTRHLLGAGVVLLALLFLLYQWSSHQSNRASVAYGSVAGYYSSFHQALEAGNSDDSAVYLAKLDAVLADTPSLRAEYDGRIAQQLLAYSDAAAASPYVARVFARTAANDLPDYHTFASTSVAAADGRTKEALEEAYSLKAALLKEGSKEQSLLFAYTLVRIAFLEQLAGTPEGAHTAWRQFLGYAGMSGGDTIGPTPFSIEAFLAVAGLFNEDTVSLVNYLNAKDKVDNSR